MNQVLILCLKMYIMLSFVKQEIKKINTETKEEISKSNSQNRKSSTNHKKSILMNHFLLLSVSLLSFKINIHWTPFSRCALLSLLLMISRTRLKTSKNLKDNQFREEDNILSLFAFPPQEAVILMLREVCFTHHQSS